MKYIVNQSIAKNFVTCRFFEIAPKFETQFVLVEIMSVCLNITFNQIIISDISETIEIQTMHTSQIITQAQKLNIYLLA